MNGIFPKQRSRGKRIETLEQMLKNGSEDEEVIIAKFCLNEGVSERKAKEYLKLLRLSGRLEEPQV